jgi:hypothetical protein
MHHRSGRLVANPLSKVCLDSVKLGFAGKEGGNLPLALRGRELDIPS